MRRSRRARRQQENENQVIQAIKWWQNRTANIMIFIGLPLVLLFVAFAWWVGTPMGRDFTGWTEFESRSEKRLESLEQEQQKTLDEFTESTNQDVQNTIDNIEGTTEDTTGAEYYNEDPYTTPETQEAEYYNENTYTAPETQESVEQPSQQPNEANNNVSERPKKTVESYDTTDEPQAVAPQGPKSPNVHYDEDGNVIENYEE